MSAPSAAPSAAPAAAPAATPASAPTTSQAGRPAHRTLTVRYYAVDGKSGLQNFPIVERNGTTTLGQFFGTFNAVWESTPLQCGDCPHCWTTLCAKKLDKCFTIIHRCKHDRPDDRLEDETANEAIAKLFDLPKPFYPVEGNVIVIKHLNIPIVPFSGLKLPRDLHAAPAQNVEEADIALIDLFVRQWANGGPFGIPVPPGAYDMLGRCCFE
ncbi:hypothetical protein MIND_01147900 [Mycena indigotica]|uniref:Uncharacterized protein n=1 Tax=Mycena indigotica TaxID=2126181 RepID=A0A8H6VZC7_9AGAR|nr:uncharacterized protein MIND_01147900 [Mycena indigotica]KAF7293679.1 hypothetical protein MIND_01147900 [Mycena indigotica]